MTGAAGRVVVVTGAAGMAGRAATGALRDAGATVIAVGSSAPRLTDLAQQLPGIGTEVADLGNRAAVDAMAERIRTSHGRVDGLIHLVGGYRGGTEFTGNSDDDWQFLSAAL
ncbi:MAG: SDR family NAD(P)-dependent oxidoreductase, partial [Nakamurella sp.]